MLNRTKHIPLYIQLRDEIVAKIKNGVWEVDSQIPTEKALMAEYEVGRVTVREGISLLVNEGYLYKKHGVGTFVARKHPSLGFEPLISLTYSLQARGINSRNVILDQKLVVPEMGTLEKLKWNQIKPCYYLKRLRYAENLPLAIEESFFAEEFKNMERKYDLTGSLAKIMLEELNLNITKVEQIIIPREPSREEQERLAMEESILVLDLERWIYGDKQPEPFYYVKFIIPSNIYSFSL